MSEVKRWVRKKRNNQFKSNKVKKDYLIRALCVCGKEIVIRTGRRVEICKECKSKRWRFEIQIQNKEDIKAVRKFAECIKNNG